METYKKYTRQGSRVLALAYKLLPEMPVSFCLILIMLFACSHSLLLYYYCQCTSINFLRTKEKPYWLIDAEGPSKFQLSKHCRFCELQWYSTCMQLVARSDKIIIYWKLEPYSFLLALIVLMDWWANWKGLVKELLLYKTGYMLIGSLSNFRIILFYAFDVFHLITSCTWYPPHWDNLFLKGQIIIYSKFLW